MKFYVFFWVVFLFVSCADMRRPKQLKKIDTIEKKMQLAKEQLSDLPKDSIVQVITDAKRIDRRIKKYYQGDTLTVDFAMKLESFRGLIPELTTINKTLAKLDSVIDTKIEAIIFLKNDIQKGAGDRSKYDDFILYEEKEINKMIDFVNYCDSSSSASLKTFNNLRFEIEQFSMDCEKEYSKQQIVE